MPSPKVTARLMRFLPSPGMSTQRSRGNDRIEALVDLGSTRTIMIVSERRPVTASRPVSRPARAGSSAARPSSESTPTIRKFSGSPGLRSSAFLSSPGAVVVRLIWLTVRFA